MYKYKLNSDQSELKKYSYHTFSTQNKFLNYTVIKKKVSHYMILSKKQFF